MAIASINPSTGATLQTFEEHSEQEVEQRLDTAMRAFAIARERSFPERAAWLRNAATILDHDKQMFARTMTEEMGKTLKSALQEVDKCAAALRHYAEHASEYLRDEAVKSDARSYVRYLPLGPVLAVMPWNFPFWQVLRFAGPALMAGNVGLLKHASNVPRCALALESLFERAGAPKGVFQTLLIGSKRVEKLIADSRVRAVTLTGSEAAGVQVAQAAGKALKKTVLELGGSDPFIVMPSANLAEAVKVAVVARNINNGQSCIAAKRFLVHREVYDEFERRFVAGLSKLRVGDPMREDTDIGPLATPDQLEQVATQVQKSVAAGAKLLLGGRRLDGPGNFYAATALANIPESAPAFREEVFGPVALLHRVDDIEHAIELANDTPFGLGSSVWTEEKLEQEHFVNCLEAGMTFINAMVASAPGLPFGGVKHSGYGRELAHLGIREFTNAKTVYLAAHDTGV